MTYRLLAALFVAASPAAAASLEAAASSADSFAIPAIPAFKSVPVAALAAARRPRVGTMTGGMNLSPVDIKIDHDNAKITGGANLSPVDLKFVFTDAKFTVEGEPIRAT